MNVLTNVILKKSKRLDTYKTKREKVLAILAFAIVFLFLASMMSFFSYTVTKRLIEINQTYAFVNILLFINFFILFTKSIFESLNVLYFSKDLRVLLRMPIKSKDILNAKFIDMIISEYQMETIMLAIPMIVYGIITKVNYIFYLYMLVILIFIPVIPILITSLLIAVIMRFTNFIKNKSKAMYITIIIALFLMSIIMPFFSDENSISSLNFREIILIENGLAESIADYFILIKPIMNILLNYKNLIGFENLIIYVLENLLCYIICVFIMSKIYLKGAIGASINSSKKNNKTSAELTLNDFKIQNKYKAYLKKELKTMIRTPIFFIECIIMPVVYPITMFIIVLGLVKFAEIMGLNLWEKLNQISVTTNGFAIFIGVGQVFYMMNFSSIISVSRESTNAIITKYIPISLNKQFNLKILIGFLINMIASFFVVCFYYMCTSSIIFSFIIFLELFFVNLIGEKFKLIVDLNKPKLDWDTEYTMMKQNTNVMYELFYTLIVGILLFIISKIFINKIIFLSILFLCLILVNIIINKFMKNKEYEIFGKIY